MNAPVLSVSHGAPDLLIRPSQTREFLSAWGRSSARPEAIVSISAHWNTRQPTVSGAARPEMIYDFHGFPEELYRMVYPAPGAPALATEIAALLAAAGLPCEVDAKRGFDHGSWAPLKLLFPDADVPVVTMAVQPDLPGEHHLALGRALRPLRQRNVLIVASGSVTHNLRVFGQVPVDGPALPQAAAFEEFVCDAVRQGRTADLTRYRERAPFAQWNHPTPEHFLPLLVALGAAEESATVQVLNRTFEFGAFSMAAFEWA